MAPGADIKAATGIGWEIASSREIPIPPQIVPVTRDSSHSTLNA